MLLYSKSSRVQVSKKKLWVMSYINKMRNRFECTHSISKLISIGLTSHLKKSLSLIRPAENPSTGFLFKSANCFLSNCLPSSASLMWDLWLSFAMFTLFMVYQKQQSFFKIGYYNTQNATNLSLTHPTCITLLEQLLIFYLFAWLTRKESLDY